MSGDPPVTWIAPPAVLRQGAPAAVLAALPGARAVGGAVRDALAGCALHDVDVAAPLPPEEIARRLTAAGLKVFETGLAHGTVTAVLAHEPVEVTSLRRDLVTDGRHAEVAWTTDWREDAARRDFTINAMSLSAAGALWDYFGGRADLAAGQVRFVGEPAIRLQEDYLRALRFFRFQARYGRGAPDPAAVAAIRAAVPGLARLSIERVWMELKRLLAAPDPTAALALMAETGVLGAILPEAIPPQLEDLRCLVHAEAPREPVLWLTVLLPPATMDQAGGIARRLKMSVDEREDLVHLHKTLGSNPFIPDRTEAALRQWYATRDSQRMALLETWLAEARDKMDRSGLRRWIGQTSFPRLPVMGRDVVAIGVEPGPHVGRLLKSLNTWWKAGGGVASRDACLEKLKELAAASPSG